MKSITYIRKERTLTEIHTYASSARVGRKKEYPDRITLPLADGVLARIDAVLSEAEPRLDMIREAIEREIKRRERLKP
jgi:hypothetical protein